MTTVAVSGGFDPPHVGHLRYCQEAKAYGDRLVVILHSDAWLIKKKGYAAMPYEERRELLLAWPMVDMVIQALDQQDGGCDDTLARLRPDVFCKGGDRTPDNFPIQERMTVERYGGRVVFGVGGAKRQSSSEVIRG